MMKVIEMQLKLPTGNGVWISKFSVGNYEAQILPRAEKRAACSATKNRCLLAGDELRNPYTDGFNDNRDNSRGNDILKYSKASITTYGLPICL